MELVQEIFQFLLVPQTMQLDIFLCGTIRHNQDEPQCIVALGLLSECFRLCKITNISAALFL